MNCQQYSSHNIDEQRHLFLFWKESIYLVIILNRLCKKQLDDNWTKILTGVFGIYSYFVRTQELHLLSTGHSLTILFQAYWYLTSTKRPTISILMAYKNLFALLVECIWLTKLTPSTFFRPFCTFWCKNQWYRAASHRVPSHGRLLILVTDSCHYCS